MLKRESDIRVFGDTFFPDQNPLKDRTWIGDVGHNAEHMFSWIFWEFKKDLLTASPNNDIL